MKSPLGKLKKLALHKSDAKDKKDHHSSLALSDGLAQASQVSDLSLYLLSFFCFMFSRFFLFYLFIYF